MNEYAGRVELFPKNIFQLNSLSYFDKIDNGSRVEEMLMNVPVRDNWSEGMSNLFSLNNLRLLQLTNTFSW